MNILSLTRADGQLLELMSNQILSFEVSTGRLTYLSANQVIQTTEVTTSESDIYSMGGCLFQYKSGEYLSVYHVKYLTDTPDGVAIGYMDKRFLSTESIETIRYRISSVPVNVFSEKQDIRFVNDLSHFPPPVAGVITLENNVTYFVTGTVDLEGNRLVAGVNTCLLGGSFGKFTFEVNRAH